MPQHYPITRTERRLLIRAIAARYKNFVNLTADQTVKEIFDNLEISETIIRREDTLHFSFEVTQVVDDILVELGRIREELK